MCMSIDVVTSKLRSQGKFSGKVRKKSENFKKLKCWPPCIYTNWHLLWLSINFEKTNIRTNLKSSIVSEINCFESVYSHLWLRFLFLCRYLMHTLDQFVEADYTLLYFHYGLNSKNKLPLSWLWEAYKAFGRKWVELPFVCLFFSKIHSHHSQHGDQV